MKNAYFDVSVRYTSPAFDDLVVGVTYYFSEGEFLRISGLPVISATAHRQVDSQVFFPVWRRVRSSVLSSVEAGSVNGGSSSFKQ